MVFERFARKGEHQPVDCCSVSKGSRIILSVGIVKRLGVIPVSVTTFFDAETSRVGLVLREELKAGAYRLASSGNTYFFTARKFLEAHRIRPIQQALPATIEEIDGQKMVTFTVRVEKKAGAK